MSGLRGKADIAGNATEVWLLMHSRHGNQLAGLETLLLIPGVEGKTLNLPFQ
jgi:hypothetical protein